MPRLPFRFNFRSKLLVLFFLSSILPLSLVAILVTNIVKSQYQEQLEISFNRNADLQKQILLYFFESNRSWIRSLTAQDILLDEVKKHAVGQPFAEGKIFASLVSVRRENSFIERAYVLDESGKVIISTATDDLGSFVQTPPFFSVPLKERSPYLGTITVSSYGKRVIPLSAPFIRKSDNTAIGVLVVELNVSIIKALLERSLFIGQPEVEEGVLMGGETYIVDDDGFPLTKLKFGVPSKNIIVTYPVEMCQEKGLGVTGLWTNYSGQKVFGVSQCIQVSDFKWTLIVEEVVDEAFRVGNQLGITIFMITLSVGLILGFVIFQTSKSITSPIESLRVGAQEIGRGHLDYRLKLYTGDELENLADSFNEMANNLKEHIQQLEEQRERLDLTAKLLLRRDLDIREMNDALEKDKEEIMAERNKLEVIISGITDAVIAVDLKRNILIFNKAAENITGFTAEAVLGKPIDQVIQVFDKEGKVKPLDYCPIQTGDSEGVLLNKENLKTVGFNNKETYVNLIAGQIREGININLGCILTLHDVSKERELAEMRLDFVSMAAHELRTPLTTIMGYLSVFVEENREILNREQMTFLTRINIAAKQLASLVENLLNVSRIERGALTLGIEPVDWTTTAKQMVEEFMIHAKDKDLKLTFVKPARKVPEIKADKLRIMEVLSNLLSNAINHTQSGGKVKVWLEPKNKEVITHVQDTGIGIPKEAQPHLFTKFFRVSGILEQGSKGTGLGLYISKAIVEMHHGKIWAESELGKGSTFSFSLPILQPDLPKKHT